ncbi:MAG TPA: acireductone synthase [Steroidobacteraceae bacterium]|nr:acireductone synthase [Steroidobacteraceae bacterium]
MIGIDNVRAVVTDIEGTTTSLAFVKEELFPYARRHLPQYVRDHAAEIADIEAQIRVLAGAGALDTAGVIDTLLRWMDEDRKVTPLKQLQGLIWKSGYQSGQLLAHVYEDAVQALRQWHAAGIRLYVYSSGSVAAQRLLFSHTAHGDLTPLFSGYFDTTTGPKVDARSYRDIAAATGLPAHEIVFLSDHPGETDAAAAAGMRSVLVARGQGSAGREPAASTFDDIVLKAAFRWSRSNAGT